jgi:O-antigen ligase
LAAAGLLFMLLQRRRALVLVVVALGFFAYQLVPVPESFVDRMNTITTYEEVQDESALGRLHFWRVAMRMVEDEPLGVGFRNYEANYDRYDPSAGAYGTRRSVHSVYFQALAETGYLGAAIFAALLSYAFWITVRVRFKARRLPAETAKFFVTSSNALIASLVAFAIGGAFAAEMLNELNWFIFGLVAALDRLSQKAHSATTVPVVAETKPAPVTATWPRAAARESVSVASKVGSDRILGRRQG